MKQLIKPIVVALISFLSIVPVKAQKDIVMTQYMHNQYALNTAFAGNREVLSLFGSYRKKWAGIEGAPASMLFSMHSALKNDNVALGFEAYNQQYGVTKETGFAFSYTYRIKMSNRQKLAFSLNAGGGFHNSNWNDVVTMSGQLPDDVFSTNESNFAPIVGFGSAWYSNHFFAGLSIPNFFHYDPYTEGGSSSVALDKANYIISAGYLHELSKKWHIQPSIMGRINPHFGSIVEINASLIYNNSLWFGAGYSTSKDAIAMLAYQITPQFRFSYNYGYTLGDIGSYNSGTHEVSIQYDFGYRVKTSSPKFF